MRIVALSMRIPPDIRTASRGWRPSCDPRATTHPASRLYSHLVSSLSIVPCRISRYSPVSGLAVSTLARTRVLLRIISPIFARKFAGLVGAMSRFWTSSIRNRANGPPSSVLLELLVLAQGPLKDEPVLTGLRVHGLDLGAADDAV